MKLYLAFNNKLRNHVEVVLKDMMFWYQEPGAPERNQNNAEIEISKLKIQKYFE